MARQWILDSQKGFETSLKYQEGIKIPSSDELDPDQVLVKIHAASLNYRDIEMAALNSINGPIRPPVIAGCDGAGVVLAVGSSVQEFQIGDRVVTYAAPELAEARGDDAQATMADVPAMLGQGTDGTLCSTGVFSEKALVRAPASLNWLQAATLPCTFTTAWNILFGVQGRAAGPGTWILVQGTGGASVATLQLAAAAGATVVATTSSGEKEARLKALGATHTVNYATHSDIWGQEARSLTPGGRGFDLVVDVGGNQTLPQSLAAVRGDGIISMVGAVGTKDSDPVPLFAAFMHTCIIRAVLCGTRNQLKELVQYLDAKNIKPALDDTVFELANAKDAYRRLHDKKHFAKVVIRVDH